MSMEEMVVNELKAMKFDDLEKQERIEDIKNYKYSDFAKDYFFKCEYEAIISVVKNLGISQ